MPNITDRQANLSIEANRMDPDQTAPIDSLTWDHTVCHRGFLNISADKKNPKQTTFVAIGALRVNKLIIFPIYATWNLQFCKNSNFGGKSS